MAIDWDGFISMAALAAIAVYHYATTTAACDALGAPWFAAFESSIQLLLPPLVLLPAQLAEEKKPGGDLETACSYRRR